MILLCSRHYAECQGHFREENQVEKKKSPNGKIITGNMQDNREKNACRGQKDEMHVSAVLDLFILDWLSLLHVTALGEQRIISTKGQLSERVVMIVYSLMHQNDTTGQSIRRVCFQMMCPRLGQRLGRNQSDNPVTKGMTGLNSIGWFTEKTLASTLTQACDNSPEKMRKQGLGGGLTY